MTDETMDIDNWRRNCKQSLSRQSDKFQLLLVDDLVSETICSFLDLGSLLNLRLVCTTTKSWIECPKYLSRLPIEIRSPKHYDRPRSSNVFWNNFIVSCENPSYFEGDFLQLYSEQIKIVQINFPKGFSRKLEFLKRCPNLDEISIKDLGFCTLKPEDKVLLGKRFENYKDFRLESLAASDVSVLMDLLVQSRSLTYLKLPTIPTELNSYHYEYSPEKFAEKQKLLWLDRIVRPLSIYIKRRHVNNNNLRYIDLDNIFDIDYESFMELARVCSQFNISILNIVFTNILPKATLNYRFSDLDPNVKTMSSYYLAIKSINGFQPGKISPKELSNLEELTWNLGLCSLDSPQEDYESELQFPKLKILNASIFSNDGDKLQDILKKLLITIKRPTVENLKIEWNLSTGSGFIAAQDLCNTFINLKSLKLSKWNGGDTHFRTLFKGLELLEEAVFKDCKYLCDAAFVPRFDDPHGISPFMKLTKLKKLWIRTFERGVTNRSFQEAFWNVPLVHLTVHTIGSSPITNQGLSSLCHLPFRNSIQYLVIDLCNNVTFRQIRRVVRQFGNLKKFKL